MSALAPINRMSNKRIAPTPFLCTCFGEFLVDGVCLAVNDEVLICCWREYGYPTLSDMQSYNLERKQFTNTVLYLKYLHPQISKLFCDGIESTTCLLFLKCFFFFLMFFNFCYCSSFGSDGNGVNNMPILHLCTGKHAPEYTTDNEVICLRVARSPTKAGIH